MPELILDKSKCLRNIEKMSDKAGRHGLGFRPHFKTHQSTEVGNWFRDYGITKITVSSFEMANRFAKAGWEDILVAFPFNPAERGLLNETAGKRKISVLIDNPDTLPFLSRIGHPLDYYIDIDTGYGRSGIPAEDLTGIEEIIDQTRDDTKLRFSGFYCHAGHSYKAGSQAGRELIHRKALTDLNQLKDQFRDLGPKILYGDTPGCSTQDDFTGIDEITPGNFVFYDLFQYSIGSCSMEEIAVAMVCPVVGKYRDNRRMVIHGGAVHFSKESLYKEGQTIFGQHVLLKDDSWKLPSEALYLTGLSQEHGLLEQCGKIFDDMALGDTLCFLPVHSCLTVNLMKRFEVMNG